VTRRQNILIITDDFLGERMAGPAIRAWNIAQVLSADHDVRLASTRRAEASSPHFAVCDGSGQMLPGLARGMDVILLQGFTLRAHPWLATTGARLVMDMYDPVHLEMLEGAQDRPRGVQNHELTRGLDALRIQFDRGDFFLCASERQRDLWLGHMSALGRVNFATYAQDNTLRKLIAVAPFGIDATPPPADQRAIKGVVPGIGPDDTVLLWAGGVYNWFDPVTLIDAVGDLAAELPQLRLVFMGTQHPSLQDLSTTTLRAAMDVARRRGLLDKHVFFLKGWVPYAERGRYLTESRILAPDRARSIAASHPSPIDVPEHGGADNVTVFTNLTFNEAGVYVIQTLVDSSLFAEHILPIVEIQQAAAVTDASDVIN